MPSTYTVNLGIEKPATGEQSGTWGDTTNVNFDILDQAINGAVSITLASAGTSGSPNTLAISDGAVSDGRNKWIEFTDGGDLGATAYVQLTPNDAEKIVLVRNSLSGSRSVILFQGTYDAGRDVEVPAGVDMLVKFSGGGATATTTNVFQRLRVEELNIAGTTTVDGVIDDDTMATASETKLATSESIKAYVDAQVTAQDLDFAGDSGTGAVDLDSQTLTIAGTANEIETSASGQTLTVGLPNAVTITSLTATSADINGGTIDGATIGGSSAGAGTFTTLNASSGTISGDLTVDTNTLYVDSTNNGVGIGTTSPNYELDIVGEVVADKLRIRRDSDGNETLHFIDGEGTASGDIRYNNSSGNRGHDFWTNNGSDVASRVRITGAGNLGIGTTSPSALLDVAGDAEINGLIVGHGAGDINTNTAVGAQALEENTTGSVNTAVGREALEDNTTGNSNTAVGYKALETTTTGSSNTAVGLRVLEANTTGFSNTAVGREALADNTTGTNNTVVGYQASETTTTGSRNTVLGYSCDPSAADGNDQVVVGYNLTGKGDDTAFIGGTNGAYNEKNVTTWETTSDRRIKKNIADNNDGLNVLSQVRVRNFEYRAPDEITELPSHASVEQDGTQIGVIAQELQQVLPECVSENSTGVLSVNTDPLVWYLINAVKELKAEIEELRGN